MFLIYLHQDCILLVVWGVGIVACNFQRYMLLHVFGHHITYWHARLSYNFISVFEMID